MSVCPLSGTTRPVDRVSSLTQIRVTRVDPPMRGWPTGRPPGHRRRGEPGGLVPRRGAASPGHNSGDRDAPRHLDPARSRSGRRRHTLPYDPRRGAPVRTWRTAHDIRHTYVRAHAATEDGPPSEFSGHSPEGRIPGAAGPAEWRTSSASSRPGPRPGPYRRDSQRYHRIIPVQHKLRLPGLFSSKGAPDSPHAAGALRLVRSPSSWRRPGVTRRS